MFGFIFADGNQPFAVALGLMLGIAILEGTMTMLGAGLSQAIDSLLPESLDAPDMDIDAAPDFDSVDGAAADFGDAEFSAADAGGGSALSKILGWLCIGKVPVLILLVAFLTVFGLAGLFVQAVVNGLTGALLPGFLAAIPALFVAIPSVRVIGKGIARLIPKDETSAVKSDSFIGRVATITIGTAKYGYPAQAKLRDRHGQTHYVMVEPDTEETSFPTGTQVLLVERRETVFRAILNTSAALVDE